MGNEGVSVRSRLLAAALSVALTVGLCPAAAFAGMGSDLSATSPADDQASLVTSVAVQAKTKVKSAKKTTKKKAAYTFTKYRAVKRYANNVKTKYVFVLPVVKGKSNAVKKMNRSLNKVRKASLRNKRLLDRYAKAEYQSYMILSDVTSAKATYNGKGYVSFRFSSYFFGGGPHGYSEMKGATFSLKTGKKLNVSQVVSGNATQVKAKIADRFIRKYASSSSYSISEIRSKIMSTKISDFPFYLRNGKVVLPLGQYAYGCPYVTGFATLTLQGNYE